MNERPTPKSVLLDLLATLPRGSMPVRALVEAGALFGLTESSMRVALARAYAAGTIERDERGRYRLGEPTRAVTRLVRSWKDPSSRMRPWAGAWCAVSLHGASRRAQPPARHETTRRTRALGMLGFRPLERRLHVRPDNLEGGVPGVRHALVELGLDASSLVFALDGLDPTTDLRARSLWDAAEIVDAYRASIEALAASQARLAGLGEDERRIETFLVGGRVLRQLALDPLLPDPIVPTDARRALVDAMRDYDRIGRSCWATFLRRHDVEHLRAPSGIHEDRPSGGFA